MATARKTILTARKLRSTMTLPEVKLWQHLRKHPAGIKFRRQHPVGRYTLDFYCPTAKLAIEIDGIVHDMGNGPEQDSVRDEWLEEQGLTIIRIAAKDVLTNALEVADNIVRLAESSR